MSTRPRGVGVRLLWLGTILAMTVGGIAGEPARIGEVKFLQDGNTDKIAFEYTGTLKYQESRYPSAKYGYVDFEPAVLATETPQMKLEGRSVRELVVNKNDETRQRVRLLYKMDSWVTPTFHDSGNRMEIRFQPGAKLEMPTEPLIPPMPALAEAEPTEAPAAQTAAVKEGLDDQIFNDYLKLSTAEGAGVPTLPKAPVPTAAAMPTPTETASAARPGAPALGGEGTPTASIIESPRSGTETTMTSMDIMNPSQAFLPASTPVDQDKITGGRGFELVDLNAEVFRKEVSVNFKEAELQNAIRLLARSADLNIVMDPRQVGGTLTVELNNVPVGSALQAILRARELDIVREGGGIYRIVPASKVQRSDRIEEMTVHFPLNWVSALQVKQILDPVVDGDIGADTLGNSIILTDTPVKIEEIANVIRRIDKPEKQVMLEARLVETNKRFGKQLETQWQMYRADNNGVPYKDIVNGVRGAGGNGLLGNTNARAGNVFGLPFDPNDPFDPTGDFLTPLTVPGVGDFGVDSLSVRGGTGRFSFGQEVSIFGQDFQLDMFLSAAEQQNLAKVLVAPRVVTLNNQAATIEVLRRIPYSSTVTGAGGVTSESFEYEDVGIQLEITPNITNNDYVRMNIRPNQTIFIGQVGFTRPTIDERRSETNVIVKDEDTAVIAGLRQQEFGDSLNGVPWLHTIPCLGWLFKDKSYRDDKTDLLAFVTPHIIKEGQLLTENEKFRYDEIDIQWDLPDYFFDDVKYDLSQ